MNRIGQVLALSAALLAAGQAFAAQRTFVSAQHGVDGNPCNVTQPCRTFGAALAVTDSGGEVIALDSGGYGPVSITQSVSIVAPDGVYAGIATPSGGPVIGISVNAPSAIVAVRGLSINGLNGTGQTGVYVASAAEFHIENALVFGFSNEGLSFQAPACKHYVANVIARDNQKGIFVGSGDVNHLAFASIEHSSFVSNGNGVLAGGYAKVVLRDSSANQNTGGGVSSGSLSAGISEVEMHNSQSAFNQYGLYADNAGGGLSVINVSGSQITGNLHAMFAAGLSTVNSAGDNVVYGNGTDDAFNSTFAKQ